MSQRFSVTVDPELVNEAVRVSGADSKRAAIELALRDLIRRRSLDAMIESAGAVDLAMSVTDLLRDREDD